jgi:transposase
MTHSLGDLAARYGVTKRTVRAWIASGELRALDLGRRFGSGKPRLRVTDADLADFENVRRVAAVPRATRRKREKLHFY